MHFIVDQWVYIKDSIPEVQRIAEIVNGCGEEVNKVKHFAKLYSGQVVGLEDITPHKWIDDSVYYTNKEFDNKKIVAYIIEPEIKSEQDNVLIAELYYLEDSYFSMAKFDSRTGKLIISDNGQLLLNGLELSTVQLSDENARYIELLSVFAKKDLVGAANAIVQSEPEVLVDESYVCTQKSNNDVEIEIDFVNDTQATLHGIYAELNNAEIVTGKLMKLTATKFNDEYAVLSSILLDLVEMRHRFNERYSSLIDDI